MATSDANDLTKIIGDCGRFQVIFISVVHTSTVISAWGMMFMAFGIYNPGWTCLDQVVFNISSQNDAGIPDIHSTPSSLPSDNPLTYEWTADCAVKMQCRNLSYSRESSTVITEWDLSCDMAWIPSMTISIQMTGVLLGSYISGQIGDKFGRKLGLYAHLALHGVCHLVAVFSVSWQMYIVLLFLIGYACGGIIACTYPYPVEFLAQRWRGVMAALPVWNIGCTTFGVVVFILRDWRNVHIATAVASALIFMTVLWAPESIRWLTVSGKTDQAKTTVAKIARINGRLCPDTHIIDDIAEEERTKMLGHQYTLLDLFRSSILRSFSIKFGIIWIILAVTYYAISFGIKALSGDFYINFLIFAVSELPGMVFVEPAVNRLGRRKTSLIYFSLVVVCSVSVVIVSFTSSGGFKDTYILVIALICKSLIICVWAVFTLYSSELYPTVVRTLHFGYLESISRIGAIVSPHVFPNDPDRLYVPFLIIGILVFINCALTWTLPETKGRRLEDRIRDKDKELESTLMH